MKRHGRTPPAMRHARRWPMWRAIPASNCSGIARPASTDETSPSLRAGRSHRKSPSSARHGVCTSEQRGSAPSGTPTRAGSPSTGRRSRATRGSPLSSGIADLSAELGDHGRVIARADLSADDAAPDAAVKRFTREHIIQAPPDVALTHVAPGGPPREHRVVSRLERPPDVHQSMTDDPFELLAFFGQLSDRPGLALLRMNIHVGSRHVEVTAHDQCAAGTTVGRELLQRGEKTHLRRKILAAVRYVDGRDGHLRQTNEDDPVLVIEGRVFEVWPLG